MTTKTTHGSTSARARGTATSGWLTFAGTLALVVGTFNIIAGLVALLDDDYYLVGQNEILIFDFTTWGWFWLAVGIVQIAIGAGIMAGRMWPARPVSCSPFSRRSGTSRSCRRSPSGRC